MLRQRYPHGRGVRTYIHLHTGGADIGSDYSQTILRLFSDYSQTIENRPTKLSSDATIHFFLKKTVDISVCWHYVHTRQLDRAIPLWQKPPKLRYS